MGDLGVFHIQKWACELQSSEGKQSGRGGRKKGGMRSFLCRRVTTRVVIVPGGGIHARKGDTLENWGEELYSLPLIHL